MKVFKGSTASFRKLISGLRIDLRLGPKHACFGLRTLAQKDGKGGEYAELRRKYLCNSRVQP